MITKPQQKWLDHLNDTDSITIKPYDPKSVAIFNNVKTKLIKVLGNVKVEHRGASNLKTSGQDEVDIYVPVLPNKFAQTVTKMARSFGQPKSLYPLVRARFSIPGYGKHVDVFVINKTDKGWLDSEVFTNYLLSNPKVLDDYRILKENGAGLSTREYYTKKIMFINKTLAKIKRTSRLISA